MGTPLPITARRATPIRNRDMSLGTFADDNTAVIPQCLLHVNYNLISSVNSRNRTHNSSVRALHTQTTLLYWFEKNSVFALVYMSA